MQNFIQNFPSFLIGPSIIYIGLLGLLSWLGGFWRPFVKLAILIVAFFVLAIFTHAVQYSGPVP
jgi:hypothetical protein